MPTDWTQEQITALIEAVQRVASREVAVPLPGGQGILSLFGGDITPGRADENGLSGRLVYTTISASSLVNASLIRVTQANPAVTVTIHSSRASYDGLITIVKDESGQAGATPIIIEGEGGETFDGSPTETINTPYGAMALYSDGTNYHVLWAYGG